METTQTPPAGKLSEAEAQRLMDKFQGLRRNLLNLTVRNKLLNFRHNERTKGFVRVVDELPNTLYKRISEGWMQLLPLPDLVREEDSPEFTVALEELRLTDPEYLNLVNQQTDDNPDSADKLEIALRQKARQKLGLSPTGRAQKSLADHARENGINPAFDLPRNPPTGSVEKWVDDRIQLLLTPELADRRLSQLMDMAGEHLKEQGVNTLFGAFGFLQWKEDDSSTNLLAAPLLLMPVQIKREVIKHHYCYQVSADGADPEVNSTLKERLRRDFGIHLPDLEEGDTPESYWAKVHALVETKRDWKVLRWITLGIFPFAKMSMYMDLDPSHWPDPSRLVQHPVLQDILLGKDHEPGELMGEPFDEYGHDAPLLVTDCDSSQLKSVKRCLGSQSAVIQGPPGTGKSQTITNLIAAALAQGETVLFVAEKLAALKVVASRLNYAGLEPFLLELHSDKVLKEGVMNSLKLRLETERPNLDDRKIRDHSRQLRDNRDELNAYAEVLNRSFGLTELSVHEILWNYLNLRRVHQDVPEALQNHVLDNPHLWGTEARQQCESWASQAARSSEELKQAGHSLQRHPWRGITPVLRTPLQLSKIKDWLEQLLTDLQARQRAYSQLQEVLAFPDMSPQANTAAALSQLKTLGEPPTSAAHFNPRGISQATDLQASRELLSNLVELESAPVWVRQNLNRRDVCGQLADLVAGLHSELQDLAGQRQQHELLQKKILKLLSCQKDLSLLSSELASLQGQHLAPLKKAAAIASGLSQEAIKSRSQVRFEQPLRRLLDQSRSVVQELQQREDKLKESFELSTRPEPGQLEAAEKELRNSHLFSFLRGPYRQAQKYYKGLWKSGKPGSNLDRANGLRDIRNFLLDQSAHAEHSEMKQAFGALHRGRQTDFSTLEELCLLEAHVAQDLSGISLISRHLREQILTGDNSLLDYLAQLNRDETLVLDWGDWPEVEGGIAEAVGPLEDRLKQFQSLQQALASLQALPPNLKVEEMATLAQAVDSYQSARDQVDNSDRVKALFPAPLSSDYREIAWLQECLPYFESLLASGLSAKLLGLFTGPEATITYHSFIAQLTSLATELNTLHEQWLGFAREQLSDPSLFLAQQDWAAYSLGQLIQRFQECAATHTLLSDYCQLTESLDRLGSKGFNPLIQQCLQQEAWLSRLPDLVRLVVAHNLADAVHQIDDSLLSRHRGLAHEELQQRFRQLDKEILQVNCQVLQSRLLNRVIPEGIGRGKAGERTEKALIQNETAKSRRHVPLRDLMARASGAVQALKPCLMMSPLSVSQYLPPGKMEFDLLIIDEASQMTPEDAVGAIARCKRVVVVGDPKQLPPTNFFTKRFDDSALDEEEDNVDSESVLDLALGVYHPAVDLRWHYRSRLASLISFSNRNFYDGRLQIFPSPQELSPHYGVKLHKVAGVYKKGLNPPEAEAIIEHSLELMARFPHRSQGIVALNQAQRDYIHEILEKRIAESDLATDYCMRWQATLEPYFVKNLENVQGDERDFILISAVYGPDENGAMAQRFGPINQSQGHRRLNVLFTRAKYSTQIFSSMGPEHIKPGESSSRGVVALKDFLSFAETGKMQDAHPTGRPPDSDFEIMVAEDLRRFGFEVSAQVGAGGYFVDLGVSHRDYPHGFLAGIECDGASYHSGKVARDRDRLRQEVLESLGWNIFRIWSTDYFRDRDRTMERVQAALAGLLASGKVGVD